MAVSDRGDEIDVNVTIDGQLVTRQLDGKAIELDPGSHQIIFERQGSAPQEMRLILGQGEKNRIIRLDYRTKTPTPVAAPPIVASTPVQPPQRDKARTGSDVCVRRRSSRGARDSNVLCDQG